MTTRYQVHANNTHWQHAVPPCLKVCLPGEHVLLLLDFVCHTGRLPPPPHTAHLPAPLSSHPSSLSPLCNRQPPAAARNPADVRFPRWKVFKWVPDRSLDCSLPPFTFPHYIFCNVLEIRFSKTPIIIMQRVVLDQLRDARCS